MLLRRAYARNTNKTTNDPVVNVSLFKMRIATATRC